VLVRPVPFAEVQMGDVACEGKALGYLIVVYGFGWWDGRARDFGVGKVVIVELQLVGYYAQCAVLLETAQLRGPCRPICLGSDSALPYTTIAG
jgi:hypothetical protein